MPAWTSRLRQGWGWVKSGLQRALSVTGALEQYVAGGGEIEEVEWENAWVLGERLWAAGAAIEEFPPRAIIPRWMFTLADIDYAGKYHMTSTLGYFDLDTGTWEEKYVSTNKGELASREDWEMNLIEAVLRTEVSPRIDWEQGVSLWGFLAEERMS